MTGVFLITLVPAALFADAASAAVLVPTTTADTEDGACDRHCSLREAVIAANQSAGPDVILLKPGIYRLSLAGPGEDAGHTGDLDVLDDTTVYGEGGDSTVIDGENSDRVLHVAAGAHLEALGLTLRRGRVNGRGGAILSQGTLVLRRSRLILSGALGEAGDGGGVASQGALEIHDSAIYQNNAAGSGGAIFADGTLRLVNVTLHLNQAGGQGGGLFTRDKTTGEINNATITANTSIGAGGGVYVESTPFLTVGVPRFRNSILAQNSDGQPPATDDCGGAVASEGHNLLGDGTFCIDFQPAKGDLEGTSAQPLPPGLGNLSENGGPTPTRALLAGSPAIDAGDPAAPDLPTACAATDQRLVERSGRCDIGAFEASAACSPGSEQLCLNGSRFRVTARFTSGGQPTAAHAVTLTGDTGLFWFFDPTNVELTVKVLNGCGVNQRYWVFASGLTNQAVEIFVTDTETAATRTYNNPQGRVFRARLDTGAFPTCP
jgi:CSLREA domain-containing protein